MDQVLQLLPSLCLDCLLPFLTPVLFCSPVGCTDAMLNNETHDIPGADGTSPKIGSILAFFMGRGLCLEVRLLKEGILHLGSMQFTFGGPALFHLGLMALFCSSDIMLSEMVEHCKHFQGSKASCLHGKTSCLFQNHFSTQNERDLASA